LASGIQPDKWQPNATYLRQQRNNKSFSGSKNTLTFGVRKCTLKKIQLKHVRLHFRHLWVDPVPYWKQQNNSPDNFPSEETKIRNIIHPEVTKPLETTSEVITTAISAATTTTTTSTTTSAQPGNN
jgi:hypothetical protein